MTQIIIYNAQDNEADYVLWLNVPTVLQSTFAGADKRSAYPRASAEAIDAIRAGQILEMADHVRWLPLGKDETTMHSAEAVAASPELSGRLVDEGKKSTQDERLAGLISRWEKEQAELDAKGAAAESADVDDLVFDGTAWKGGI